MVESKFHRGTFVDLEYILDISTLKGSEELYKVNFVWVLTDIIQNI